MTEKLDDLLEKRADTYGEFNDVAEVTQRLYLVVKASPNYKSLSFIHKEAFHMIFHKIARLLCGNPQHLDTVRDIAGYSKLLFEHVESLYKDLEGHNEPNNQ